MALPILTTPALRSHDRPATTVVLWSVKEHERPLAMALNALAIHVLGDVFSPAIVGRVYDYMKARDIWYGWALFCLLLWNCWAIFFWGLGWYLSARRLKQERALREGRGGEAQPLLGHSSINNGPVPQTAVTIGGGGDGDDNNPRRQRVQTLPPTLEHDDE